MPLLSFLPLLRALGCGGWGRLQSHLLEVMMGCVEKLDSARQDKDGCPQGLNPGQDKGTLLVATLPFFTRSGYLKCSLVFQASSKPGLEQGTGALPCSGSLSHA